MITIIEVANDQTISEHNRRYAFSVVSNLIRTPPVFSKTSDYLNWRDMFRRIEILGIR